MGADQIGYLTVLPTGREAVSLVKKRVAEFASALEVIDEAALAAAADELRAKDPKLTPDEAGQKATDAGYEKARKALDKLGVDTKYLAEFKGFENDEQIVDAVKESIESLAGFDPTKLDYRDTVARRDKINGRDVVLVFAGEMSWGDEPDGGGYTVLNALEMTGLLAKLEAMVPGLNNKRRK